MSGPTDRARIDDLAAPRWSPEAQPYVDGLTAYGETLGATALTPERLRATAEEQTGLGNWGPPDGDGNPTGGRNATRDISGTSDGDAAAEAASDGNATGDASATGGGEASGDGSGFERRLELLCLALREEAGLSALGIAMTYESLLQTLRGRLLVEDLIDRHPEIEEVQIVRPIVICGLPRTGTTHLHNLLSADPALRHLPYWESLEPILPPGEAAELARTNEGAGSEADPRRERTQLAVDLVDTCMPLFKRMHEMTVDHAHEEIQLLALDAGGMFFETTAPMPSWRADYTTTDQTPCYRYLRRVLQALTWLRPEAGDRWVLKSPQHLEQLGPLAATFPDATFVVTHRDPVAVTASTCTMLAYTARLRQGAPDPKAIGTYWSSRVEELLLGGMRDRELLPSDQTVDVVLDDFVADEEATVRRIYAVAGQPFGDAARTAMRAFTAAHPRGRHGTIAYDLDALGIDAGSRRAALSAYRERYDLRDEGL